LGAEGEGAQDALAQSLEGAVVRAPPGRDLAARGRPDVKMPRCIRGAGGKQEVSATADVARQDWPEWWTAA